MTGVRVNKVRRIGLTALVVLACCRATRAAEPNSSPQVPEFHRVYIPAEKIQEGNWAQGYLPIDTDKFKRLLETVSAGARGAPTARGAQMVRAHWSAQLTADDLLVGSALLDFERVDDAPRLYPLAPWSPAIGRGKWRDRSQLARLGAGTDGKLAVLVEGDSLELDWSLRGQRTASGAVAFHVELPVCPVAKLVIDLPHEFELLADDGLVSTDAGPSSKLVRWTVELGGNHAITLRVVSDPTARERRPLTLLRQSLTYDFSPRGINLGAQLKLDIHGEPIQRLAVDLDPSLMLVAARYGELQVPWSATLDVETRVSHVVLQLPEPISGTGRVLQLSAIAPLTTGKRFRLPGLQAESVSWQEGTTTLLIPDSLVVEQFAFDGCRQSQSTARPAPETGDAIEVQCYRPSASLEVVLALPRWQVKAESGSLVEVGASEVTSQTALSLSVPHGQRRTLEAVVLPRWTVDSVSHAVSGRPTEWEVDDASEPTRLSIHLDEPLTPSSQVRLVVRGHRQLPTASSFEARQFQMLDFDDWLTGSRIISVRANEGAQLRWSGSVDLKRLDPLELVAGQLDLFVRPPNGLLFSEDSVFAQSIVAIDRRKPSFTADIRIDAVIQRDVLTETYTLACVPESASVERLLVRLSQARTAALEWKLAGVNSGQFSARRISAGEQAQAGLRPGGEAWEINLRLSRPGPFELRAVRSVAFDGETHLSLASVGDAVGQRGTLTIRALGDSGLAIKNRRLTAVPAELVDSVRYQTARAAYHYQPTGDDVGGEPAVSLEPSAATQAESGAWAWVGELDSHYMVGRSVHWATFRLQTAGRERVRAELPVGAVLQSVWLDRERVSPGTSEDDARGLIIDLTPGNRLAVLTLYYALEDGLPGLASSQTAPFAKLDVPVMARTWQVSMPSGYEVLETDPRFPTDSLTNWTWNERLFGMLARSARQRRFNPLSADAWRGVLEPHVEQVQATSAGERFLENLGTFMSENLSGEAESQLTWGQLIQLCADEEAKLRRTVLIDLDSLARVGLSPNTRVRFQSGNSLHERGAGLLDQAGLALWVAPNLVVVAARNGTMSDGQQLAAVEAEPIYTIAQGPLQQTLDRAAGGGRNLQFALVPAWQAGTAFASPSPWVLPDTQTAVSGDPGTRNSYRWRFAGDDSPQIRIVHLATIGALAWAVLLTTAALGIWLAPRPAVLVGGIALAGALALWLPAAFAPLAGAALIGGSVCLLARLMRIPVQGGRSQLSTTGARSSRIRAAAVEAGTILAVLIIVLGAQQALASASNDEKPSVDTSSKAPAANATSAPATTGSEVSELRGLSYRVVVPVDNAGKPATPTYYIPDSFYKQLHRLAAAANGQPKGWLVTRANYHGVISRDPVTRQLGMATLKASFDIRVFQSNVQVFLPLIRDSLGGVINGMRIEGRSVVARWNDSGTELLAGSLGVGEHRLELEIQTKIQSDATTSGIDVAILPLANSTVLITLPPDLPTIDLPTAHGRVQIDKDRNELSAQLGADNHLAVRWPSGAGAQAAMPTIDVDELIWMRVRPGTTILDAKFKFRVLEGRLRQVQLLADPRLRLLPSNNPQSPVAAIRATPGDPQRIELDLTRSVEDQVVIEVQFLLTGSSGVGNLRLPRLESTGTRAAKRWLAVNVDPALEYHEQLGEDSRPLTAIEFAAAWGLTDLRPQAVYGIPRGETMWILSTQPTEPQTTVEDLLAVSFGKNFTAFELNANISIVQGYLSQLTMQVPGKASIERVSVLDGDAERVARWSMAEDGRLTVFLTTPLTGEHRLRVRGRTDVDPQQPNLVPRAELLSSRLKRHELQLFRQGDLLVQVEAPDTFISVEPTQLDLPDDFGTRLASYRCDDLKAEVMIKKSGNSPQAKAVAVTSLDHGADSWTAQLEYHLDVSNGLVDVLQFEIPPQWSDPYQIEPSLRRKIVPVPGEARRQMFVYPQQPIGDHFKLKIRGRVALSPGDRLRVPEIVPQRVQEIERYVVVPRSLDGQQVAWETMGLTPAELPREFVRSGSTAESASVFHVSSDHFQAAIKAVRRARAASKVKLADIHVAWTGDNRFRGVAMYDLQAAGADHCLVELPSEFRLVHALLEGLPAQVTELVENQWRIALGPSQLPQRLEFVYCGPLSGSAASKRFQAPRLVDLETDITLWTIDSPIGYGSPRVESPAEAVEPVAQMLARLECMSSLVQLPAEAVAENLPEELARWYRPWRKRYQESRAMISRESIVAAKAGGTTDQQALAGPYDQVMAAVETRIGAGANARNLDISASDAQLLLELDSESTRAHYRSSGAATELTVRYAQVPAGSFWSRAIFGSLVLDVGAVTVVFSRHRTLPQFAPSTVMAAVGFAWWLFLTPSVVGLFVLIAAIVLAWRSLVPQSGVAWSR